MEYPAQGSLLKTLRNIIKAERIFLISLGLVFYLQLSKSYKMPEMMPNPSLDGTVRSLVALSKA